METKFTPGPWFADQEGNVWRRDPADLYQNGGTVAGDKPLAAANKGWTAEGEIGYPAKYNARLIAAAPELFEALVGLESLRGPFAPSDEEIGMAWKKANAAIAKATGEQS